MLAAVIGLSRENVARRPCGPSRTDASYAFAAQLTTDTEITLLERSPELFVTVSVNL
jgi:hypothetical protein